MTQPAPNPTFGQLWTDLSMLPRWALLALMAGAGGLAFWMLRGTTSRTPTNTVWATQATGYLTQRGYTSQESSAAVNAYNTGQQLTPVQVGLVSEAVAALGTPDMPISPSPVTPNGSGATTTAAANPGSAGYWTVTSIGVGWSSTFRGIAQQLYGNPSDSQYISAINPGVAPSDFSMIPAGTRITVPRSLT